MATTPGWRRPPTRCLEPRRPPPTRSRRAVPRAACRRRATRADRSAGGSAGTARRRTEAWPWTTAAQSAQPAHVLRVRTRRVLRVRTCLVVRVRTCPDLSPAAGRADGPCLPAPPAPAPRAGHDRPARSLRCRAVPIGRRRTENLPAETRVRRRFDELWHHALNPRRPRVRVSVDHVGDHVHPARARPG